MTTRPIIQSGKIMFTSEGGSVVPMTRAAAEKSLADFRTRLPKVRSETAKASLIDAIATYEAGVALAKANGL